MLQSFRAQNFKCFADLTISKLEPVNLITGLNNTGKTALLEALFLHAGYFNPTLSTVINVFRGIDLFKPDPEFLWGWHFYGHDLSSRIHLTACHKDERPRHLRIYLRTSPVSTGRERRSRRGRLPSTAPSLTSADIGRELRYEYTAANGKVYKNTVTLRQDGKPALARAPFPSQDNASFLAARTVTHNEDARFFDQLNLTRRQDEILRFARFFDPRLKGLSLSAAWGPLTLVADMDGQTQLMPIPFAGEGLTRFLSMLLHILQIPKGLLLIDEVENGIHHTVLPKVWQALAETAKAAGVQIIATTHSQECVRAAHQAFSQFLDYGFRLHRLERVRDDIKVITYDRAQLERVIEAGFELR